MSQPLSPEEEAVVEAAVRSMVLDQVNRVVRLVEDVGGIGLPADVVRSVESAALTQWSWLGDHFVQLGGESWRINPLVTGAGREDVVRWEFGPDGAVATSREK